MLSRVAATTVIVGTVAALGSAAPVAPPRLAAAGGVQWTVPPRWQEGAGSAMRVATYSLPPAKGAAAGECAVFHFGSGEGGSVDANVERWGRQFEGAPKAIRTTQTIAGLRVTRVELNGTYLAPGGPMMQSTGQKAGYRLLGVIVEAPAGNVFFKLTGPAATVGGAERELEALVASLRRK